MKITTVTLFIGFLIVAGCTATDDRQGEARHNASETSEEYYTCPMHPSVRSDRPGACPVCGMALVKKTALQEASSDELAQLRHVSLSPTQRVIANVSTEQSRVRRLVREVRSAGIVDFAEPLRATVSARFRGRLETLHVNFTGERVKKGQPLFELYSPDLISAEQDYLLAHQSVAFSSTDAAMHSGSRQLLNAARDRLKIHFGMTEAQISRLETSGKVSTAVTFYAPLSGTVITKEILEGQYVDEGTPLYEVADLSRVWVYFDMYETEINHVRIGQEIAFSTDAYPGQSFAGNVTFVDPVMNADTRTVRVRIEASNPRNALKPGMFVMGRIRIQLPPALTVPSSAVLSMGKREVVWVEMEPNAFVPRTVTVGVRTEHYAQVLKGLSEGETIVVTGGYLIDSESALQSPATGDPHQGHGSTQEQTAPASIPGTTSAPSASRTIHIHVKGAYQPNAIRVRQGETVALDFFREEESACTKEVVFEDFNIRKQLAAFQTTRVELTPQKKGTFTFTCGMDMVHGTLIVE